MSEADSLGTWSLIGYKGPGEGNSISSKTNNFSYADGIEAKMAIPSSDQKGWGATNNMKLNDCTEAENWTVSMKTATGSASGDVAFTADVTGGADCIALTPSFGTIGK